MRNIAPQDNSELEALEQREWRESLDYVIQQGDRDRVHRLLSSLRDHARAHGRQPAVQRRDPVHQHDSRGRSRRRCPGSQEIERRIKSLVRWNAMAMVVRGNRASDGIGGHISTYASAATLYEVGFNHFFRGKEQGRRRRHRLFPGPRLAGHLRPRVPRRAPAGREADTTSAASSRPAVGCRRIRTRG